MKKILIILVGAMSLIACNGGSDSSGGGDNPPVSDQAQLVTIGNGSSSFLEPLQTSINQSNSVGGSNSFCYTIGNDNILYYINKVCNSNMIHDTFKAINLLPFYNTKDSLPINTATDSFGNIYVAMRYNNYNVSDWYLVKCSTENGSCQDLGAMGKYQREGFTKNVITNDNAGNLYAYIWGGALNPSPFSYDDYGVYSSTNQAADWTNISYNLSTYNSLWIVGLLHNSKTDQVISEIDYSSISGDQNDLLSISPVTLGSWQMYFQYTGFNEDTVVQISYSGIIYKAEKQVVSYYQNGNWVKFNYILPDDALIPVGAYISALSFDHYNNIYMTFNNGKTLVVQVPV